VTHNRGRFRFPLYARLAKYREAIEYARWAFRVGTGRERRKALDMLDEAVRNNPREEP
jgi:hypothetical protein